MPGLRWMGLSQLQQDWPGIADEQRGLTVKRALFACLLAVSAHGAILTENRGELFPGDRPFGIGVGHCCYVSGDDVIYVYVRAEPPIDEEPSYTPPIIPPVIPPVVPPIVPPDPPPSEIPEPALYVVVALAIIAFIWRTE